ncbi:retrovirus-related pol polyprotein from transposon TNT 1-94 [Tanacetum coccineum]
MSMMGKMSFFLGLQISQSPRGIFLNQSKYALEIIKKYGMETNDPVDTPMVEKSKLDEDPQGKLVDPTRYRVMSGSLMYLTSSRPDLVFVICICLWYLKDSCIALTAFADADHAGCLDTRSTSGSMQNHDSRTKTTSCCDNAWVPATERIKISTTNMRINPTVPQKEETYQFWYTFKKIKGINSYEFDLANKKCTVDVEIFRKILGNCLRVQGEDFVPPPSKKELLTFLLKLGYKGQLNIPACLLKFVRIGKDFQEYGRAIPDTMLTDEIKQSETYQMFIKYSIGWIPLKKSIGKGSQGKKTAVNPKASVEVSDESDPEPAKRQTSSRTSKGLAADTMQAIKNSKKTSKRQPHTGGSSEGDGVTLEVLNESIVILTTSSEGTGTKPGVPAKVKGGSEAKGDSAIDLGSKKESEYSEEENVDEKIDWVYSDEEEEKKDDADDDRSIDLEETDDEKTYDDEFMHGDEYVHDEDDEEMKEAEVVETRKDEEITDAEKTDAEKTEVIKGDLEQAGKLPLTSSSLSVSSGFGNQFLNLSSDTSLISTIKEIAYTEINSLLDIQIQQEPIVLSPIPEIPTVTAATTLPPPPSVTTITLELQQTKTPISTPPIITVAPAATTVLDPLPAIAQRVYVLEKDIKELKQVYHSLAILATIRSQVPAAVDEYLGSSLADALQKDKDDLDRVIPYLRKRGHEEDKDPSTGSNQGKRKKSSRKDFKPSKTSSASKETSKGDTPPKTSKTGKSASAKESVKEATHKVTTGNEEPVQENVNDADQPQDGEAAPKNDWFKQPPRPPTPDTEWNKCQVNRLKLNKITKADLVGPVYNLLKGTCQSSIELEYNMEESFKALTDRLDWDNLEGDLCPFDLSKPLPLKGHPGHLTVVAEYFFNNDLKYLKSTDSERKYTTSITKMKDARFSKHEVFFRQKIMSVVSVKVNKLHGYGYLEEIVGRRVDRQLYKFKEVIVDLVVALRMFTRSLVIKKRVKDVQLGVESYQKKLNITKPQKDFLGISAKELKDMPRRKWSDLDKRRSGIVVEFIDKKVLEKWILGNLEGLVGAKELEMDYKLIQRTIRFCHTLSSFITGPISLSIL